jgi:murein L,D-transpeptidase YafK
VLRCTHATVLLLGALAFTGTVLDTASATDIAERRRAVKEGRLKLPLPGTPDTEKLLTRLWQAGTPLGTPLFIRIFKAESDLEVWIDKGGRYELFASYPICFFSGGLGPKMREGDRQTPEGFYTVSSDQLHFGDRIKRSLDLGFPNAFDDINGRSGSAILIHGGCDSIGCFAVTNPVNSELYDLVSSAIRSGESHVPVQVFPFRMTDANMESHATDRSKAFWDDLKVGYDSFERTRVPPKVSVCGKRYRVEDGVVQEARTPGPVALCQSDAVAKVFSDSAKRVASAVAKVDNPKPARVASYVKRSRFKRSAGRGCTAARPSCRRWAALHSGRRKAVR